MMNEENKEKFIEQARLALPNEACGLVVIQKGKEVYFPCNNIAVEKRHSFIIDPVSYAQAEELGEVVAVVHSHPKKNPKPTQADLVDCEAHRLPWFIYSVSANLWYEFSPSGYKANLIGREFHYGVLDCYSLVRDYYEREKGITLFDLERSDETAFQRGESLYEQNMEKAGFRKVENLEVGDVILMQIGFKVPCHAAIYLGNNQILHHMRGRLSSRDVFGEYYRKRTRFYCRYFGEK